MKKTTTVRKYGSGFGFYHLINLNVKSLENSFSLSAMAN